MFYLVPPTTSLNSTIFSIGPHISTTSNYPVASAAEVTLKLVDVDSGGSLVYFTEQGVLRGQPSRYELLPIKTTSVPIQGLVIVAFFDSESYIFPKYFVLRKAEFTFIRLVSTRGGQFIVFVTWLRLHSYAENS